MLPVIPNSPNVTTCLGRTFLSAQEIRWIQRFNHFAQAFSQLSKAIDLTQQHQLLELEEQGLIQAFAYTHELAVKTLRDFLEGRGVSNLYGSKDTTHEAFKQGLLSNGEAWMDMIKSWNLTTHTCNEETAQAIAQAVCQSYFPEFIQLLAARERLNAEETK
jgi:nucleotidyltransferase substrate binding protein (TIGR01987 family)